MNARLMIGIISICLISGCAASHRSEIASRAQTELIGMSKKDLLSCAGVPVRQERVDDLEFLTYTGGGDSVATGYATQTSPSSAVVVSKRHHRYCEATFILKEGKVEKINYQGRTGGLITKGEQCAFIVENCLSQ
ncbi:MAG: hypothetical protein ABSE95_04540 [Thermodesulfobacteriota bacterium]